MGVFRGVAAAWLAVALLAGCGGGERAPADLRQAAAALKAMSAPRHLSRSAFSAAFPDGTPSQYVSYLFSDMGAAEWPVAMDETEAEGMRAARIPVLPPTVRVVALRPDPGAGRQLVVSADDARGVVVVRGYETHDGEPLLEREWSLPRVKPAPGVAEMHRSAAEMGASDQAF